MGRHLHTWNEIINKGTYIVDSCGECGAEREIRNHVTDTYTDSVTGSGYHVRRSAPTSIRNQTRLASI